MSPFKSTHLSPSALHSPAEWITDALRSSAPLGTKIKTQRLNFSNHPWMEREKKTKTATFQSFYLIINSIGNACIHMTLRHDASSKNTKKYIREMEGEDQLLADE